MKITERQQLVLTELESVCRKNFGQYKESCPPLHARDLERIATGDRACVFGNGGLTFQVASRLAVKSGAVLAAFKALESKGLIIRETSAQTYQRPLYWWPVGLAAKLHAEQLSGELPE